MPAFREHMRDDNSRVTAGIPSLSPSKRREITEKQLLAIYQKACQNEYRKNEADALAADGAMEDTADWDQVVGIPLEGWRVCARLKKLNSRLWFERSINAPDHLGIYILKNDFKGGQEKEFLCGIPAEMAPEFTLRLKNEDGSVKGKIPGWRNTLMKLIRARLITAEAAFKVFGPPSRDSEMWARFTS
jgi:hypothetical protein